MNVLSHLSGGVSRRYLLTSYPQQATPNKLTGVSRRAEKRSGESFGYTLVCAVPSLVFSLAPSLVPSLVFSLVPSLVPSLVFSLVA